MNYDGYEQLRKDVAALANSMYELRDTLNSLESSYRYNSDVLTERLARQTLCRINTLYLEAYREVLALDACFKD